MRFVIILPFRWQSVGWKHQGKARLKTRRMFSGSERVAHRTDCKSVAGWPTK